MRLSVAFLRGINVGGAHKLPMAELRAALEDAGAVEPETHIQSGNAVFSGQVTAKALGDAIRKRAGFAPDAVILSARAFRDILAANPFPEAVGDPKALHVLLLPEPSQATQDEIDAAASDEERAVLTDRALYLHTPRYLSGSKIAPKADRLLGVRTTGRNWRTLRAVADMLDRRT